MAQQDTGLGWSAKDEWLFRYSGQLCEASQSNLQGDFPCWPEDNISRPNVTSWLVPKGIYYMPSVSSHGVEYPLYTTTNANSLPPLGYFIAPVNGAYHLFIVASENFSIPYMSGWFRIWYLDNGYPNPVAQTTGGSTVQDPVTGLYYRDQDISSRVQADTSAQSTIPFYASFADGMAAMAGVREPFYKVNDGYAVACVAKWKTTNGTELISPILISSDTNFVDMSTTSTEYNFAKLNHLLSGMRFYMGFWDIPGDVNLTATVQTVDLTDRGNITLDQLFMTIISTTYAHIIIINSPDPYEEEGAGSGEEGGDGEDLEDDEMGISHHAIPAAINTGFCRIYCPTEQQLRDLSNYLWSSQYDLAAVKKLFANPMDSVLGLSAVPLTLGGANRPVYLGGVDTEMSFPMVDYQSYQVPMGAITVEKRWGSYLDYDPYTRFSIFLPFIGFKDLSADDIMGKQIILDYDVDILSGACTARLQAGGNVLYQWSGQCSIQLPVTASNWNQVFQGATSAALTAGLAVATGTAGPVLAGALAAEGAQAIMGKPRIERGGSASGAAGWMGGLTPYLVRVTPEAIIPEDQNKFIGYPAFSSISLGDLTGYNEISSIHLEGIPATGAELEELEAILKGGVIF